MPLLLYRYMLVDLLKVFMLAAAVLVAVIAFGLTIRPLTDEGLFGPAEAFRFMLLAVVPTLQFALPFAAGFASTIVLHRMSSDNEIIAAAASGISYRKILAPLIGLGVGLTLAMVVLTQTVIPRFEAGMVRVLTADIARLLQASVERGVPLQLPGTNWQVYADDMRIVVDPPDTRAQSRLVLQRVAIAELDRAGRIDKDLTAHQAIVDVYRSEGSTYLMFVSREAVGFDRSSGQLGGFEFAEEGHAIHIPNPIRDTLRAMTRAQLLAIRANPDLHGGVREAREVLQRSMLDRAIAAAIERELSERGAIELEQHGPTQRRYIIRAAGIEDSWLWSGSEGGLAIEQREGGEHTFTLAPEEARLTRSTIHPSGEPIFDLEMHNVTVTDHRAGNLVNRRSRLSDTGLHLVDVPIEASSALNFDKASGAEAARRLERRIESVQMEVTARILMRYAQAATAVLLLVLGATLAMLLRGTLPLVIYAVAFIPSILDLIMISGGDKMMRDGHTIAGFAVMWGGNAALLAIILFAYYRLSRN